jgi:hypothetical protein
MAALTPAQIAAVKSQVQKQLPQVVTLSQAIKDQPTALAVKKLEDSMRQTQVALVAALEHALQKIN